MIIYQEITAIDKLQGFLDNINCKFVNKLKKKKKNEKYLPSSYGLVMVCKS